MKTNTVRQETVINAAPHDIFEALMDSKKHSQFTGDKTSISRKVGGKFSVFGGWATGVNLELIKDKKIVQSWRGAEWPAGHYSKAVFKLTKAKNGTKLVLTQTGVPSDEAKEIASGWKEYYWEPMKDMLEAR